MWSSEECRRILDEVIRLSDADETEAYLGGGHSALTRFANNSIHQNVEEMNVSLTVRTVLGKRAGRASTNKLDHDSLVRVIEDAKAIARVSEPDAGMLPVPGPAATENNDAYVEETASTTAEQRAAEVGKIVSRAETRGLTAAGKYLTGWGSLGEYGEKPAFALANSRGHFACYRCSRAEVGATIIAKDSSGWVGTNHHDARRLDIARLGDIATWKAEASANPREVPPGAYTVILEPEAVANLLWFLVWTDGFNALAADEERCFATGKVGQKLFGENITIEDDAFHPLHMSRPWDGEGVPKKKIALVENGVLKSLVYDRRTAAKHGVEPTGHGFPAPNLMGAWPTELVVHGGSQSVEDLVRSTERGILVTRFWYNRTVDPMKCIVTGMTRDGTFLVEGGKIVSGLKNFRFNESALEMLNKVEAMSAPERADSIVVPAMKVRDFHFTSVTRF
jgi:predicted Zn-dependent protease